VTRGANQTVATRGVCGKCGEVHERCSGHNVSGLPCRRYPTAGANVCMKHGAAAPQVKAAARRRLAESKVRKALDEVEIREVDNPLAELRKLTGEVVAWKDVLASHVANLTEQMRYTDDKGAEQLRAEVALYERALDRAGKFLEMWARLGIDAMLAEMTVRVTEGQVAALTRGLDAYRTAAGVGEYEHQAGLAALAKEMRR